MLANTVAVPLNIECVNKKTCNPSNVRKTSGHSFKIVSISCNKSNPYISGMDGFRGYLFEKGASVKAANLISNSWRKSSLSGYELPWKKWPGSCNLRAVDSFQCTVVTILDYSTSLFEACLEYNTISVYRPVISAYRGKVDDMVAGQHIFVDVQVVLNIIKKDWGVSSSLIDQEPAYKLCLLVSLTQLLVI